MKMDRPKAADETWTFHRPVTAEERWNAAVERQQLAAQIRRMAQPSVGESLQRMIQQFERIEQRLDEICELWRDADEKNGWGCSAVAN